MVRSIIICLLITVPVLSVKGQDSVRQWTLKECIEYAVANNIDIKERLLDIRESELNLNTSKNSRLPDLNTGLTQYFNFGQSPVRKYDTINDIWLDAYESTRSSSSSFSVTSGLNLFAGGRIGNQIKSDRFDLQAALFSLDEARENLELQVGAYFIQLLYQKELVKLYQRQLELTRSQIERTQILVEAGSVPRSQYLDIIAQEAADQTELVNARNEMEQARLNLAHLLNITDIKRFDVAYPKLNDGSLTADILIESPEAIYSEIIDGRPAVNRFNALIESGRYSLKVAKAGRFPTLSLTAGYSNYYYYVFDGLSDNRKFRNQLKTQGNESIVLTLNVPIFNRFETRNRIRFAALSIDRLELQKESSILQIRKEINQAYQSAAAAQSKMNSAAKAVDAATESYRYMTERYEVGRATAYELNETQVRMLKSEVEQLQSLYDFLFRTKILIFYRTGRLEW